VSPATRLLGVSFWEVLVYLLNAVLFVLAASRSRSWSAMRHCQRGGDRRAGRMGVHHQLPDTGAGLQRLVGELLEAQRREIVLLRNQGEISNEVMHRIERDLELEDARLEI
jgi:hypothetical protein